MTSLVNIGELTLPVTKLIEKISDAIGVIYEPSRIVRKAKAEAIAMEIKVIAESKSECIKDRAIQRIMFEESQNQSNIESIIEKSLPKVGKDVAPESIERDWLVHFFDRAKMISDNEMQNIWAKLLAGEANAPGSYSKISIRLLSELDRNDAILFVNLMKFTIDVGATASIIFEAEGDLCRRHGLNFTALTHLDKIGLVQFNHIRGFVQNGLPKHFSVKYFDKLLNFEMPNSENNQLDIGHVLLSNQGLEIASLVERAPEYEILESIIKHWQSKGIKLQIDQG